MCDKLKLEVGKTYISNDGRPVSIVHKGHGDRAFLGVVNPDTKDECTCWYLEDGEAPISGLAIVREKRPIKTFRYKRYLYRSIFDEWFIHLHREGGPQPPTQHKWIDEDWQTIEVEVP